MIWTTIKRRDVTSMAPVPFFKSETEDLSIDGFAKRQKSRSRRRRNQVKKNQTSFFCCRKATFLVIFTFHVTRCDGPSTSPCFFCNCKALSPPPSFSFHMHSLTHTIAHNSSLHRYRFFIFPFIFYLCSLPPYLSLCLPFATCSPTHTYP